MDVAVGAGRVGEVLLAHEDERRLRHPSAVDEPLDGRDLAEGAADVHRARTARRLVRPRDATRDGEIDLEDPRAVTKTGESPRDPPRHPLTGDAHGRGGRDVEHDDVGCLQLVQRLDADAGLDPSAEGLELGDHGTADGARPTLRNRPAVPVRGGPEDDADGGGHRRGEGAKRVRGDAGEERLGLRGGPPPCEQRCGRGGVEAEPGHRDGVPRHVQHRPEEVRGDAVEAVGERSEQRPPAPPVLAERAGGLVDRSEGGGAAAAVQRVGVLDLRPKPAQAMGGEIEPPGEGRVHRQGMSRGALVVEETGNRQLGAPGATAGGLRRLDHEHLHSRVGEGDGGSEPVGPAADDDRAGHPATSSSGAATPTSATCPWLTRS